MSILIRGQLLVNTYYCIKGHSSNEIRIVALADLHGRKFGKNQNYIIKKIEYVNPDIIVYVGDMIERNRIETSLESVIMLTKGLVEIAPVYYVDGNHELDASVIEPNKYYNYNQKMKELGAVRLENEIVSLKYGNAKINICGITAHYSWGDLEEQLIETIKSMEGINVMLCHYPETVLWNKPFNGGGLDVAICGHTHGGLIRVPFKGGVYAPEYGFWPMYVLGEYPIYTDTRSRDYGGHKGAQFLGTMIISGGLSGEHHIPRINNPCEISVIDIKGKFFYKQLYY